MKLLLDTNVLIHREANRVVRPDIGTVFRWMDRLHYEKCVHPASIDEIRRHRDKAVVEAFEAKLQSYSQLRALAQDTPEIVAVRQRDRTANDRVDTDLLAELAARRVDAILTEDRGIHAKAAQIGLATRVFTIDALLEKVTAENPDLAEYKVLSVKKELFGRINLKDPFFDSFRRDYPGFDDWFNRKANDEAYVCFSENGEVLAFLYLKRESAQENYGDIDPVFRPCERLKIGTFKVVANGFKLGERFLKIIFDNALLYRVDEIYATLFLSSDAHDRLAQQLEEWGFARHGTKRSAAGEEQVFVRNFRPRADQNAPQDVFPYVARAARKFIVPIRPEYHTELLPDSILRTESPQDFVENRPNRNAIHKVYISRSIERGMRPGDVIVFYRTKSPDGPAYYTAVATTLGVIDSVAIDIGSEAEFIALCRKRSVFSDKELAEYWNYNPRSRPFVVNFLYVYSLPRRPNLRELLENGVIQQAPRGFEPLADDAFNTLLRISNADTRFIVD
jgi:hypothetical protein